MLRRFSKENVDPVSINKRNRRVSIFNFTTWVGKISISPSYTLPFACDCTGAMPNDAEDGTVRICVILVTAPFVMRTSRQNCVFTLDA